MVPGELKPGAINAHRDRITRLLGCGGLGAAFPRCHKLLGSTHAMLEDDRREVRHDRKFLELALDDPPATKPRAIIEAYEMTHR